MKRKIGSKWYLVTAGTARLIDKAQDAAKAKKSFKYWWDTNIFGEPSKTVHMRIHESVVNDAICKDIANTYPFHISEVKRIYERSKHDRKYTELILKTAYEYCKSPSEVMDNAEAASKAFVEGSRAGATLAEAVKAFQTLKSKDMKKVTAPEGYQFKNGKTEKKVFKIEVKRPTTIKELRNVENCDEYYYNSESKIYASYGYSTEDSITRETAEAIAALTLLIRYRDAWNEGWKQNLNEMAFYIFYGINGVGLSKVNGMNAVMSFKSPRIRDEFYIQFKDLLEKAKMLL